MITAASIKKKHKNLLDTIKFEIINAVDSKIGKDIDIVEILKLLDQLKLLQKIILNESQCFMLQNKDLYLMTNKLNVYMEKEKIKNLTEQKYSRKKKILFEYFKERRAQNSLSQVDCLLFKYLEKDLKEGIIP